MTRLTATASKTTLLMDIQHRVESIRRLCTQHPRAARALEMANGIAPLGLTADASRALATMRWQKAEIERLENIIEEIETAAAKAAHRADCMREIA